MITLNALANILPINGENTGMISDSYPNLYAPAGYTFSIWGVIYILLGLYVFYNLRQAQTESRTNRGMALKRIATWFIISSLANSAWILAWHYRYIPITVILMLVILISLIQIMSIIKTSNLSSTDKMQIKLPMGVYFGWITVAFVANVVTWLVSVSWKGFGISEEIWLVVILAIATLIAVITMLKHACAAYGLVVIWAFVGILMKHLSVDAFSGQYKLAIASLGVYIVIVALATVKTGIRVAKEMK